MELIALQKKLNESYCPHCLKDKTLQAGILCDRDLEKNQRFCQCSNCGFILLIDVSENFNFTQQHQLKFSKVSPVASVVKGKTNKKPTRKRQTA